MRHYIKHIYLDTTFTVEWSVLMDGPWTQKEDNLTVNHNHNFYEKTTSST